MDEQKFLIVDKRQGFKDLTGDVESIKSRGDFVDISFRNSEKTFAYARKNSIFAKNNIPLLRLVTNDSNEYEKIANFIFGERKTAGSFYGNP